MDSENSLISFQLILFNEKKRTNILLLLPLLQKSYIHLQNIQCICSYCLFLCSIVIASPQLEQLYSLSLCSKEDCLRILSRYQWNLQQASRYLIRFSQDERPAPSDRDRRMWHLFYLFDAPVISPCTGHLKMYAEWSCR